MTVKYTDRAVLILTQRRLTILDAGRGWQFTAAHSALLHWCTGHGLNVGEIPLRGTTFLRRPRSVSVSGVYQRDPLTGERTFHRDLGGRLVYPLKLAVVYLPGEPSPWPPVLVEAAQP